MRNADTLRSNPPRHLRRAELQAYARNWHGEWPVGYCQYRPEEHSLWREVHDALAPAQAVAASRRYLGARRRLSLCRTRLPQMATLNRNLTRASGFRMAPSMGGVAPSEFFHWLSRAIFMATLDLRDPETPLVTREPDYIHEVMGHGIMLADPTYAAISQSLAIAAEALQRMGASLERQARIERVYWYTMETGLVREEGETRAFGAALLSSVRALESIAEHAPRSLTLDEAAERPFTYSDLQSAHYVCDDLDLLHDRIAAWLSRELLAARIELSERESRPAPEPSAVGDER
ncbi:MAG: hypothetical protein R3B09_17390 [Nannocystaceae bacterium]